MSVLTRGEDFLSSLLGADLQRTSDGPFEITRAGGNVLLATPTDDTHALLVVLDAASGMRVGGALQIPVPSGYYAPAYFRFGHIDANTAALYGMYLPIASGNEVIRRTVLSLAATPPTILENADVLTDADYGAWSVLDTVDGEFIVYPTASLCVVFVQPAYGSATAQHLVGTLSDCGGSMAMGIRDRTTSVSATNPVGVAWEGLNGPLRFVEVPSAISAVIPAPTIMTDSAGAYRDLSPPHLVSVYALPGTPGAGHWLVANVDQAVGVDPHTPFATVQLREIIGSGAVIHRLGVPAEMAAWRTHIDIASSGGRIRIVERANDMGLVTRAIGCE